MPRDVPASQDVSDLGRERPILRRCGANLLLIRNKMRVGFVYFVKISAAPRAKANPLNWTTAINGCRYLSCCFESHYLYLVLLILLLLICAFAREIPFPRAKKVFDGIGRCVFGTRREIFYTDSGKKYVCSGNVTIRILGNILCINQAVDIQYGTAK